MTHPNDITEAKTQARQRALAARAALGAEEGDAASAEICRAIESELAAVEHALGRCGQADDARAADHASDSGFAAHSPEQSDIEEGLCGSETFGRTMDRVRNVRRNAEPPLLAAYEAMGDEADPACVVAAAFASGWRVALPCLLDRERNGQVMAFRAISEEDWHARRAPFQTHPIARFAPDDPSLDAYPVVDPRDIDATLVPLVAFDDHLRRLGHGMGCYDRYLPRLSPACVTLGIAFEAQRIVHVPTDEHDATLGAIVTETAIYHA